MEEIILDLSHRERLEELRARHPEVRIHHDMMDIPQDREVQETSLINVRIFDLTLDELSEQIVEWKKKYPQFDRIDIMRYRDIDADAQLIGYMIETDEMFNERVAGIAEKNELIDLLHEDRNVQEVLEDYNHYQHLKARFDDTMIVQKGGIEKEYVSRKGYFKPDEGLEKELNIPSDDDRNRKDTKEARWSAAAFVTRRVGRDETSDNGKEDTSEANLPHSGEREIRMGEGEGEFLRVHL